MVSGGEGVVVSGGGGVMASGGGGWCLMNRLNHLHKIQPQQGMSC